MDKNKLTGRWAGEYIYGANDDFNFQGVSVPFIIDIICNEGQITGTCVDAESKKFFNQPATIEGTFDNNIISFIKKYPCLWILNEREEIELIENQPSQEIHYFGTLSKHFFQKTFDGEWTCSSTVIEEDGKRTPFLSSGTWTMTKK